MVLPLIGAVFALALLVPQFIVPCAQWRWGEYGTNHTIIIGATKVSCVTNIVSALLATTLAVFAYIYAKLDLADKNAALAPPPGHADQHNINSNAQIVDVSVATS